MIDLTRSSTDIVSPPSDCDGTQSSRCVIAQIGENHDVKRIFTYEEAAALLPEVQRLTDSAVDAVAELADDDNSVAYQQIVGTWAESLINLGIEVKGLWLADFDNGSGYYCWSHPEPSLQYFHGYEDGFQG